VFGLYTASHFSIIYMYIISLIVRSSSFTGRSWAMSQFRNNSQIMNLFTWGTIYWTRLSGNSRDLTTHDNTITNLNLGFPTGFSPSFFPTTFCTLQPKIHPIHYKNKWIHWINTWILYCSQHLFRNSVIILPLERGAAAALLYMLSRYRVFRAWLIRRVL
jgi:hypothetical protein